MKAIAIVLLSLVLAGCVSNIAKDFGKPFEVRLEAKPNQGTVKVLTRNADEIARRAGRGIRITPAAARDYDASLPGLEQIDKISDDAFAVVDDPEVQIVIELIGGYEPARELVLRAIANGKHVVTANKALIAFFPLI